MADNPGLENHRIKSFKNKGRDVEVSVLPRPGPARFAQPAGRAGPAVAGRGGRAGFGLAFAGSSWVRVGCRLRSARPRPGQSGRRAADRVQPPSGAT